MPMVTIRRWVPDIDGHTALLNKLSGGVCRVLFGMPPLWISGWTCAAGLMREESVRKLLAADILLLIRVVEALRVEGNWSPALTIIAERALSARVRKACSSE